MQIAVIGAGLAGLAAADRLADAGHSVVVWEKSRGAGGRTATRRAGDLLRFDHGAPFLHDGADPLVALPGVGRARLQEHAGPVVDQAVGTPTANAPAKHLARGLELCTGRRVAGITPSDSQWVLHDDAGTPLGAFDGVIVAVPAPQAAELLATAAPELAARAASVPFAACWSAMVAWEQPLGLTFSLAREQAGLSVAIAEEAKPGRAAGERWVLQADPKLSWTHLEHPPDEVIALLLDRFSQVAGKPLPPPDFATAHRWRFARPTAPLGEPCLVAGTLVVAGDWCIGTTAGAALRSGDAAAAALAPVAA